MPVRNLTLDTERGRPRYGYLDPYANGTGRPEIPRVNNWTYITSDTWFHNAQASKQFGSLSFKFGFFVGYRDYQNL